MSAIFLSHSSRDDAVAREVATRLKTQGHASVFLDFDPEAGIPAGRDWEQELYQQLRACQAVVILCSRASMASRWCFAEITHAKALGKHVFPLKVEACEIDPILTAHQVLDFTGDPEDAYARLWRGLTVAGLDPADAFDWDGRRAPYPGLLAFQEADAAIFFGREREIQDGLEQLQRLRQFGGARLALVLGASGSGKSSLVRAGLLPRLRRDPERWLVVDPFRPGEEPLRALAEVWSRASERLGLPASPELLRARLDDASERTVIGTTATESPSAGEPTASEAALAALAEIEKLVQKPATPELESRLEILRRALSTGARPSSRPPRPALAVPGPAAEMVALATELLARSQRTEATVLLVIDQFEELLTLPDARSKRFLEILRGLLEHPSSSILILATLRSDFLGHLQRAPALVGMRFDTLAVGPMAPEAVAHTIERPAALAGLDLEPGLTEALVEDARAEDALPLLAFTLRELWERHARGRLTIADYRDKLGGLAGSVARVADAVVHAAHLTETQERDLRRSFLKLARLNEEGRFARQPAAWAGLSASARPVLERFVQARLLVSRDESGERVLEVAHEALLRSWDRLRGWLDEDREYLLWRKRLHSAFVQWEAAGCDDGALLRGVVLAESERWLAEHGDDLAQSCPELCRFVEASTLLREREEAAVRRRRRQVLLAAVSAAVVFLVLALIAGGFYVDARRQSRELQAGLIVKTASTLRDPVTSALLLIEAGEIFGGREPPGGARAARSIAGSSLARSVLRGHENVVTLVAWSPDGTRVVTGANDGGVRVWRADGTGIPVVLEGHREAVRAVAWNPDGTKIATASADATARVWNADGSGQELILEGHEGEVRSVAWSPDGTRLVTASADATARVWEAGGTGEPILLAGHTAGVLQAVFSPDGSHILTTSEDETARVWRADGVGTPRVLAGHTGWVIAGRFSHDGRRAATCSRDRTARIWNLAAPGRPLVLEGHESWVWNLDWSPDDTRLATASGDRTARIWDVRGGAAPIVLEGHDDWVRTAVWSPDGRRVLTTSHDGDARLWEIDTPRDPKLLVGHEGWVRAGAWSPDGTLVATASDDKTARIWSAASEAEPLVLSGHDNQVWSARFSHDDQRIASAAADRTLRLWNAADGTPLGEPLRGHADRVRSLDWSLDDRRLASGSDDKTARIWTLGAPGEPIVLEGHGDRVFDVAWSHDGERLATASADDTVRNWTLDPISFKELKGFGGQVRGVAWSPDDRELLTGADDDKVELRRADGTGEARLVGQHRDQVMSVAWSPDGQKVASASGDRTATIWALDGKAAPIRFEGHEGLVWSIAWSPDGRRVVTASADWTARVWSADGTGDPIFLDGHEGPVWHAAFSNDGTRIVTASADWTLRIWKLWSLDWPALARHLRERTNACLPARERERYLGETHERAQKRYEACETSFGRQAVAHEDGP